MTLSRRRFLAVSAALPAGALFACSPDPDDGWRRGPIAHLIPSASHRAFFVKVSFEAPRSAAPVLRIDEGVATLLRGNVLDVRTSKTGDGELMLLLAK